jgi:GTP1/Obg family GTP-binding protein
VGDSLKALEDQYMFLTQQLSMFLASCQTQDQRNAIMTQYVTARRNYWNSINKIFHDDDPRVISLVDQMHNEQKRIKDCTNHLGKIAQVIDTITEAVTVGTKLAAMAG